MKQRLTFILGASTALLLAAGAAWAALPTQVRVGSTIQVADAGTVTVDRDGSTLRVAEVQPAIGWSHEVETAEGRQVEVDFRNGNRRLQFDAQVEDGEIRVRIRERVQASSSSSTSSAGDGTSTTIQDTASTSMGDSTTSTVGDTTSTTVDDTTTSTVGETTSTTIDDTTSTTTHNTTSTTVDDSDGPIGSGSDTYTIVGVASVTISWSDGQMTLVSVSLADGWSIEDRDLRSDRIELEFENGDTEAEFEADFHHGTIRVETKVD